jgi:hypothetical protein
MGSIFAPEGYRGAASGGAQQAKEDRLDNKEQSVEIEGKEIANSQSQAEFFDYLDATEARVSERKAQMAQDKTTINTQATDEAAINKQNELAQKRAEAAIALVPAQKQNELDTIHRAMDDRTFDQVTRVYAQFQEGIKAGHDPAALYDQSRKALMASFVDKAKGEEFMKRYGIGPKFNEQAVNSLSSLSSYALHNAATTREEHLLDQEWKHRAEVARINARSSGSSPEDLTTKAMSADERRALGNMYSAYIKDFEDFQGGIAEDGTRTGEQGAIVDTVSMWSANAQRDQILGDDGVTPYDYQRIAGDIINMGRTDYSDEGWFMGTANSGDDFKGFAFMNAADTAMAQLEILREEADRLGQPIDLYALWKVKAPAIMASMAAAHRQKAGKGQKVPTGSPSATDTPAVTANANTGDAQPDPNAKPVDTQAADKKISVKAANIRLAEIRNALARMPVKDKRGPKGQALIQERKRLKNRISVGSITSEYLGITFGDTMPPPSQEQKIVSP